MKNIFVTRVKHFTSFKIVIEIFLPLKVHVCQHNEQHDISLQFSYKIQKKDARNVEIYESNASER